MDFFCGRTIKMLYKPYFAVFPGKNPDFVLYIPASFIETKKLYKNPKNQIQRKT